MHNLLYTFLVFNQELSGVFPSIRASASKELAGYLPAALALTSIIGFIVCVGLVNKLLNPKETGGGVGLFDFLRPVYLTILISIFPSFIGIIDGVTSKITDGLVMSLDTNIEENNDSLKKIYDKMNETTRELSTKGKRRMAAEEATRPDQTQYFGMMGVPTLKQSLDYGKALAEAKPLQEELEEELEAEYKCSKVLGGRSLKSLGLLIIDKLSHLSAQIFETMANIILLMLSFLGPFVFAFAMMPKFASGTWNFVGRYIQISFWKVCAAIVLWANIQFKHGLAGAVDTACNGGLEAAVSMGQVKGLGLTMTICNIATILMILEVPKIAGMIIESAGASGLGDSVSRLGTGAMRDIARDTARGVSKGVKRIIRKKK